MKAPVSTLSAPKAIGPYSQGVQVAAKKLIFTSGQIALHPETMQVVGSDIESQTKQVMENLKAVLAAAGADFSHVVKSTIFLKNMEHFAGVNQIYGQYFQSEPPARSTVEVSRLPKDVLVEIEMIAALSPED